MIRSKPLAGAVTFISDLITQGDLPQATFDGGAVYAFSKQLLGERAEGAEQPAPPRKHDLDKAA